MDDGGYVLAAERHWLIVWQLEHRRVFGAAVDDPRAGEILRQFQRCCNNDGGGSRGPDGESLNCIRQPQMQQIANFTQIVLVCKKQILK